MIHLNHVFELTLTLDGENFAKLLNRDWNEFTESGDDKYYDHALADKGIIVAYHDKTYKKKVKLTVVPGLILDDKPHPGNIQKLIQKLEKHVSRYFHSRYELNDFKLNKMGIVTDIDVHGRKKVSDYMKAIQRIGKVKGFSPSRDNRKNTSFCLEGNSNGIDFLICDCEAMVKEQLTEADSESKKLKAMAKDTEGILRTEVWLKNNAIQSITEETAASEQIINLLKNAEKIFLNTFKRVIPYGSFYKKDQAIDIIQKEVTDRNLRRKMLRLLALVPEKKSLLLAQKAMNCRRIEEVMSMFFSINLSPVTLSKRHEIKHLENLYEFLS